MARKKQPIQQPASEHDPECVLTAPHDGPCRIRIEPRPCHKPSAAAGNGSAALLADPQHHEDGDTITCKTPLACLRLVFARLAEWARDTQEPDDPDTTLQLEYLVAVLNENILPTVRHIVDARVARPTDNHQIN